MKEALGGLFIAAAFIAGAAVVVGLVVLGRWLLARTRAWLLWNVLTIPGPCGPMGAPGGLNYRGHYSPDRRYTAGDIVHYLGGLIVATETGQMRDRDGHETWDATEWRVLAQVGGLASAQPGDPIVPGGPLAP